jgi:hypothetical protein
MTPAELLESSSSIRQAVERDLLRTFQQQRITRQTLRLNRIYMTLRDIEAKDRCLVEREQRRLPFPGAPARPTPSQT